jgi:hypothetical protein
MAYGPHPEPSTKASSEAVRKRKADAGVRPMGKQVKIAGKKRKWLLWRLLQHREVLVLLH